MTDREQQLGTGDLDTVGERLPQVGAVLAEREHVGGLRAVAAHEAGRHARKRRVGRQRSDERQPGGPARPGVHARPRGDRVDRVLRHPAIRRELAADDGEHRVSGSSTSTCRRERSAVASSSPSTSGRRPAKRPMTSARLERELQRARDERSRPRSSSSVTWGSATPTGSSTGTSVSPMSTVASGRGRAKTKRRARAVQRDAERGAGMAEPGGVDDEVRSAAGAQAHAAGELAGPDAGGVDDVAGRDAQLVAGELVADDGAVAVERLRGDAGQDPGAVGGGGAGDGDDERGVVGELAVPAHERAAQARRRRAPGTRRRASGASMRRALGSRWRGVPASRRMASPARRTDVGRRDRAGQSGRSGVSIGSGATRCGAARSRTARSCADSHAMAGGRPPDSAGRRGELRAPAARALGEIAALDERDAQAARGGVQGDAGAGDAAADDEDVDDPALRELAELAQAPVGGERGAGFETV